ncbi:MAG: alanine racemase [Bacillota bacterium]
MRPVWAEIDVAKFVHNLRQLRKAAGGTDLMAVVKADAYGHGAVPLARAAVEAGARYLGVAIVEEGVELREAGITAPILVLGASPPEQALMVVEYNLTQTVASPELVRALGEAAGQRGRIALVHLKLETGMGRIGVAPGPQLDSLLTEIQATPGIRLEGVFTHLAAADQADQTYSRLQMRAFESGLRQVQAAGFRGIIRHVSNSAGIIALPGARYDLVRAGISLYGYFPSSEVRRDLDLRPVLSWKARISHVKEVPAGYSVGYGCTYHTQYPTTIATVPLGYADGFPRLLSNRGEVLVRGVRCQLVGRVCMDQIMLDVGKIDGVQSGEEAVIIGQQGNERLTADDLARGVGTISYEILTGIQKRVPRVYR